MTLVGRQAEFDALRRVLNSALDDSQGVIIEAPPGIGKSALLTALRDHAGGHGWMVLSCRPGQAEAGLSYAALGDLFAPIDDLGELNEPQRAAIEAALLRRTLPGGELDTRALGSACAAVLATLAIRGRLLIVVDDAQWLDQPSAAVLRFALRRLPPAGVAAVLARRPESGGLDPGFPLIELGPLPDPAIADLAARALPSGPLRPALIERITTAAAGNPLFAVELARHAGRRDPGAAMTLPRSLESVITERFTDASSEVRECLLATALAARPDVALLVRLGLGAATGPAERLGVLDTTGGNASFTHPLFETSVGHTATPAERRAMHARLAEVVSPGEEATHHRGLAAVEPHPVLAAELAELAELNVRRGALHRAAELARLAERITPSDAPLLWSRAARAGMLAFQAGHTDEAIAALQRVAGHTPERAIRVRALIDLNIVMFSASSSDQCTDYGRHALALAETDAERAEALAILSRTTYDDFAVAHQHALDALDVIAGLANPDPVVHANALIGAAGTAMQLGRGLNRALYDRAIELEVGQPLGPDSAFAALAADLKVVDELDEARHMLLALVESTDDDGSLPYALSHLPQLELWSGNWHLAEQYARRHLEAAEASHQRDQVGQASYLLGLVAAHFGRLDEARTMTSRLDVTTPWTRRNSAGLLGFVALSEGDASGAVALLGEWDQLTRAIGVRDPGSRRFGADLAEALIATGDREAAGRIIDELDADAVTFADRPRVVAMARRMRALLLAASVDDADEPASSASTADRRARAVAAAGQAVELLASTPFVFDRARALMGLGQIHRRFKEKAAARAALEEALAIFDRLGAVQFTERARLELSRVGSRTSSMTELTETERRVAELAATGRTVRQVADELYISPKTVEANLTRVYRKLGLKTRAELATWVATGSIPV